MDADVIVIGGGAAGFFAAIHCAEANPDLQVRILEKGNRVLTKVLVSGGGRCNVTHSCFDPRELVQRYPRGMRELLGPFHAWQPRDTIEWFASRGVSIKTEEDGRMFPSTDRSETIADCLINAAKQTGVRIQTDTVVSSIERRGDHFVLRLGDHQHLTCSQLMLATGGLKPGKIHDNLSSLGHTIQPLAPSLFTFHIKDQRLKDLPGLSVENAFVQARGTKLNESGPVLITHWGLSGPAILKLSAWGARELAEKQYRFDLEINWASNLSPEQSMDKFKELKQNSGRKKISGTPRFDLPRRLWERLVNAAAISEQKTWGQIDNPGLIRLAEQITASVFAVNGKSMNKEEFVTCGGVTLKEVNFKTMESRKVPGLHFGGEVLDIDAITGGFNFQAAWTTGRLAGLAMAQAVSTG
ncbi:MAG: NAD(P)/FAD-dependent oxidoreductase [Limisphaerales bacterium]